MDEIIYLYGYTADEEEAETIYAIDLDGSLIWAYNMTLTDADSIAGLYPDETGLWVMVNHYEYDTAADEDPVYSKTSLLHIGEINQEMKADREINLALSAAPTEIAADRDKDCLYVLTETSLVALDYNGGILFTIDSSGQLSSLCFTSGGELAVRESTGEHIFIQTIDSDNQAWDSDGLEGEYTKLFTGQDYELYCTDSSDKGLFGIDLQTGETVSLFQWLDLGISTPIVNVIALEYDTFLVAGLSSITLVQAAGDSSEESTKTLTLATFDYQDISYAVLNFNQSQSAYQVVIRDYSEYNTGDDNTAGLEQLYLDIASGDAPDLYDLRSIPVSQFVRLGLLEDMNPYIDEDSDIDREDYVETLLTAMETDGGLYGLMPHVSVISIAANPSVVDDTDRLTLEDIIALAGGSDPFGGTLTQYEFIQYMLAGDSSPFIDWSGGTCSFDSEDFIQRLELMKLLPETLEDEDGADTPLLYIISVTGYGDILYASLVLDCIGSDTGCAAFFGLPGTENDRLLLYPSNGYWGISSLSENKEGAWTFVRQYLLEDYQTSNSLSLLKTAWEEMQSDYSSWLEMSGQAAIMLAGQEYDLQITSDIYYETALSLAENASGIYEENPALAEIILDEASAFLAGDKTAAQAAENIQSRVSIYMAEQG
ncbi:MAG: extracellular solute-binding protein [Oscillospiraceae bacterium]|nr:extracellular solute-binding protein [Oscillospiraceae bacterium]